MILEEKLNKITDEYLGRLITSEMIEELVSGSLQLCSTFLESKQMMSVYVLRIMMAVWTYIYTMIVEDVNTGSLA